MHGLSPDETAALLGKPEEEVEAKARELGLALENSMKEPVIVLAEAVRSARLVLNTRNRNPQDMLDELEQILGSSHIASALAALSAPDRSRPTAPDEEHGEIFPRDTAAS